MRNYSVKLPDEVAAKMLPLGVSTEIRRRCIDYDRVMGHLRGTMPAFTREEVKYIIKKLEGYDFDKNGVDTFNKYDVINVLYDRAIPCTKEIEKKLLNTSQIGIYVFMMRVRAWYAWAKEKHTLESWLTPTIHGWEDEERYEGNSASS